MNKDLRIKNKNFHTKTIINNSLLMIRKSVGFTLIELLIVIAIIGVLSAILMTNFIGIRQRARDSQRKSDLRQIQSALELYRTDIGGYPSSLPSSICGGALVHPTSGTTYMIKLPCDPLNSVPYRYSYAPSGAGYSLSTCLENPNDSQKDTSLCSGSSTNYTYTLTNP